MPPVEIALVTSGSQGVNTPALSDQLPAPEQPIAKPVSNLAVLPVGSPEPPILPVANGNDANLRPVPYIVTPSVAGETGQVRMVTVILRQSGDKVRDNVRLRQAYGILISYPGADRFAFLVYERGRGYQIEFPKFTTGLNPELLSRLHKLVGAENVKIDVLKFH